MKAGAQRQGAGDDSRPPRSWRTRCHRQVVNLVLQQAVQDRASDIHFERSRRSSASATRDGALYEMAPPPKHLALRSPRASRSCEPEHFRDAPAAGRRINLSIAGSRWTCA